MKHASLQKHLPHAPQAIYDLIMDIGSYPAIYPMVKTARITATHPGHRDIEMEFNLPPVFGVSDPVQVSRVTGLVPSEIKVTTLKSPLKALDLHWQLKPDRGGTSLTFNMSFETGRGFLVDTMIHTGIGHILSDTLRRFEAHAGQVLAARPIPRKKGPQP